MLPDDPLARSILPKARRLTLALLYGHPDRAFYLREVVALTRLGVGHVQRELKRLTAVGILVRSERGRHVYFQANGECPIFAELRGIVTKTVGAGAVLRDALAPIADRIVAAFIYGSVARGQEQQASDLDLLVIGEVSFAEVADAARRAEPRLRRAINVSLFPPGEFAAKMASGHHFLASVMKHEKTFVLGDADELGRLLQEPLDTTS